MKAIFGAVAMVAALMFAGAASAGDAKGVIKAVNGRVVQLADGANYTIPAPAAGQPDMITGLAAGQTVTLTFTTAGTINTVSKVAK